MSRSPLPLLLDFDTQYQRDRDQTPAFLHRRDRRLALAREEAGAEPPSVAEWLHAVNAGHHDPAPLRRWRRATLAFTGAGAVLGVLAAAKRYDEVVRMADRHEWTVDAPSRLELYATRALIVG